MQDRDWIEVIRKAIHEGDGEFIYFGDGDIDYAGLAKLIHQRLAEAGFYKQTVHLCAS